MKVVFIINGLESIEEFPDVIELLSSGWVYSSSGWIYESSAKPVLTRFVESTIDEEIEFIKHEWINLVSYAEELAPDLLNSFSKVSQSYYFEIK